MKYAFILLFSLFYYAQHVSSGGWRGGRVRKLRKLTKEVANLEEDLSCLKEDVIECNKESKELNDKITKLQTILSTGQCSIITRLYNTMHFLRLQKRIFSADKS